MPVNEQVIDAVTAANVKNLGDAPAEAIAMVYQGLAQTMVLAMQDSQAAASRRNVLADTLLGRACGSVLDAGNVAEAIAASRALSSSGGTDLAAMMSQLLAALNSGQQGVKSAQTTPPVTP